MNETLKRALSGFVYVLIMWFGTSFSELSFQILFLVLGIVSIYGNGITQDYCTYQQADTFFSYRRDKDTGRMATLVWIDNN